MSPDGSAAAERDSITATSDDWPHTKRLMPWLIAGFLAMVFLIPIDGTDLKVHLPFNSKIDRFALVFMIGFLAVQALVRTASPPKTGRRMTAVMAAVLFFTAIVLASLLPNVNRIYRLGELTLTEKAVSQMLGYIAFFLIIATQVRRAELPAFGRLVLALAIITAVGTLYESRTGYNVFYDLSSKLLSPIANCQSVTDDHPPALRPAQDRGSDGARARRSASMLAIAFPFAVVRFKEARTSDDVLGVSWQSSSLLAASLCYAA